MPDRAGEIFAQEFVVSFGFFSGLWVYVGIDPQTKILEVLASLSPHASPIIWIFPTIIMIVSIFGAYRVGGIVGLFAVFLAFLGGVFITSWGWILLIAGYFIGLFAPQTNE